MPAADLLLPAVALAEDGVPVSAGLAAGIDELVGGRDRRARTCCGSSTAPRSEGDLLRQPALAQDPSDPGRRGTQQPVRRQGR